MCAYVLCKSARSSAESGQFVLNNIDKITYKGGVSCLSFLIANMNLTT